MFDPEGVYGMAVIEVDNEEEANAVKNNDPAVTAGICTALLLQMQVGMARS